MKTSAQLEDDGYCKHIMKCHPVFITGPDFHLVYYKKQTPQHVRGDKKSEILRFVQDDIKLR